MIASIFIPRLGDIYGRKKPFYISLLCACFIQLGCIISTNLILTIAFFFLLGLTQAGKFSMAHVYLQELMPVSYRTAAGTLAQFADAATIVILALYFRFVSKDWLPFQVLGLAMTFISAVALALVPDSPKYLYSKGKFQEARDALKLI
jgi:putative MFS transporter